MEKKYFIKYNQYVNQSLNCRVATLIFSNLEYWLGKKEKIYRFIEPCQHVLYKTGQSWTEILGCSRKTFTSAFDAIGIRYPSLTAYKAAQDKFQGKMFASVYDRYSNKTYFIKNDQAVKLFLTNAKSLKQGNSSTCSQKILEAVPSLQNTTQILTFEPVRNGNNCRSYTNNNTKNTSSGLSSDKPHAGKQTGDEMLRIWDTVTGLGIPNLRNNRLYAFLIQALKNKFDNCLKKWQNFCQRIFGTRFLMGHNPSKWKVTLDWVLKFINIDKILANYYGIPIIPPPTTEQAQQQNDQIYQEINETREPEYIQHIRCTLAKHLQPLTYKTWLADAVISADKQNLHLLVETRFKSDWIYNHFELQLKSCLADLPEFMAVVIEDKQGIHAVDELSYRHVIGRPKIRSKADLDIVSKIMDGFRKEKDLPDKQQCKAGKTSHLQQQQSKCSSLYDRSAMDIMDDCQDEQGRGQIPDRICQQLQAASYVNSAEPLQEPVLIQQFRQSLLQAIGAAAYSSWFGDTQISLADADKGILHITATTLFKKQWIRREYEKLLEKILYSSAKISRLEFFVKGKLERQGIIERFIPIDSNELDLSLGHKEQDHDHDSTLANSIQREIKHKSPTEALRWHMTSVAVGKFKPLPDWLVNGIAVKTINSDGIITLALPDRLQAIQCRLHHIIPLFEHVYALWPQVKSLRFCIAGQPDDALSDESGFLVTMLTAWQEAFKAVAMPVFDADLGQTAVLV